ncbi:DUF6057 family protein [Bacteroidales bacterium OttesenSCG-928-M06]|nr:DUF6057 family protein [Bacteroidales bacterium OttesenSCG-928-M06]
MAKSDTLKIYKISSWIISFLFVAFATLWMFNMNQYNTLRFLEEIQLFRTDWTYYNNYISEPGGLALYLSSFFTQFYYYPLIGAIILSLSFYCIYLLLFAICKQDKDTIYRYFSLLLIVPILLLFVYNTDNPMHIKLANFLGIILPLAALLIYLKINKKYKYIGASILYIVLYFIVGGNALLFVGLILINELFQKQRSYILMLIMIFLAIGIPYLSYRFTYVTTFKNAYLSLTPHTSISSNLFYTFAWYAVPFIYLLWKFIAYPFSYTTDKKNSVIIVGGNIAIILALCIWGIKDYDKHEMEYVMHMAYNVEQGSWDKVIEMGNKVQGTSFKNAVPIAYFMNVAHLEKGDLLSNMFQYRQTGTYGLYVSWALHHTTDLYIGELYYRMGIPAIAEQCAFEAMVTSPHEHSSKAIKRIIQTNIMRKDTDGFEKYIRLFEKSPIHKNWAKEQKKQFQISLENPDYKIPDIPEIANYENFFFASGAQESNFISLLEYDAQNKKAFEYLSATFLLKKDLFSFLSLMDDRYLQLNYSHPPRVIEEALVILAYNNHQEVINKYNVSQETINQFVALNKELNKAATNKAKEKVREKYKNTYWIYYQFVKPMELQDIPGMMVY